MAKTREGGMYVGTTLILSWSRHCTLLVEMGQVLLSWPF